MKSETIQVAFVEPQSTFVHPEVVKRISLSGILYSLVMFFSGLFLFVSIFQLNNGSSVFSMLMMILAAFLVLWAVYRFFWCSKEMVYLPTGSRTIGRSYFFDMKHLDTLSEMIAHKCLIPERAVKCENSGNVRLDVLLSQDNRFIALQLFQFVPYSYQPITPVCYFTDAEAATVSAFLLKCKQL